MNRGGNFITGMDLASDVSGFSSFLKRAGLLDESACCIYALGIFDLILFINISHQYYIIFFSLLSVDYLVITAASHVCRYVCNMYVSKRNKCYT